MKNIQMGLAGFLVMLASTVSHSQQFNVTTDTLQWAASSLNDLQTDTVQVHYSKFITYGSSALKWIQQPGTERETVMTLTTDSTSGNWNNSGYYYVYCSKNGKPRTFKFENENGEKKVTVVFTNKDNTTRAIAFLISELKKLTR